MRCRAVLLKSAGLTSEQIALPNGNEPYIRQFMGEALRNRGHQKLAEASETRTEAYDGLLGRRSCAYSHQERQTKPNEGKEAWQQASAKKVSESTFRAFLSAVTRDIDV